MNASLLLVQVELLSGGVNMPVTPLNVYEYVRKYAEHRMLVVAEQPLHVSTTLKKKSDFLLFGFEYNNVLKFSVYWKKCFCTKMHIDTCN